MIPLRCAPPSRGPCSVCGLVRVQLLPQNLIGREHHIVLGKVARRGDEVTVFRILGLPLKHQYLQDVGACVLWLFEVS